ncbi:MAG: hypothetical protein FJ387_10770 [Verrucomicrobia bacterium]|nr:hypothetical protein [Verrucomicrobiota bacterium]
MNEDHQSSSPGIPQHAEALGMPRNGSEPVGGLPNDAARFRSTPKPAGSFRDLPTNSEPKPNHTLTVRQVARMFEAAGVARTERSITNWCQPNKTGVARLDAYYDPNEHRYFITPESVELAIEEEKARTAKHAGGGTGLEPGREDVQPRSDSGEAFAPEERADSAELRHELKDLKIANRAKDQIIEMLRQEREGFVEKLMNSSRRVGELETRLRQLSAPRRSEVDAGADGPLVPEGALS